MPPLLSTHTGPSGPGCQHLSRSPWQQAPDPCPGSVLAPFPLYQHSSSGRGVGQWGVVLPEMLSCPLSPPPLRRGRGHGPRLPCMEGGVAAGSSGVAGRGSVIPSGRVQPPRPWGVLTLPISGGGGSSCRGRTAVSPSATGWCGVRPRGPSPGLSEQFRTLQLG